jgi:adenylylsulfate kinase
MIYWFTGQPSHGKTVLADKLHSYLQEKTDKKVFRIDGDDMRELFSNKDYSINGRVENIGTAQRISHYLHNQDYDVVVSLVSPYVDQREDFKKLIGDDIIEFYIHCNEPRERDHFRAIAYKPPVDNYVSIDTTENDADESFGEILTALKYKNINFIV